ncbi:oxidoreductase [Pleurocapsa sp. CCALA 161]|uniref:Gfo/Idh/MocA family protein n=1 Tax=Pleurocapsa sp. CCALA 161 TaxID=2107688 RepID=UPI000D053925|nr:oxidoreductase [Pleurocapsa sp. CCALA 161]
MISKNQIGVAVVGTGFGQKIHIPGFQHHPRTEVVAVYNRDLNQAQKIADEHKIYYAYNELDKILSLPEVDAVSISTPPFLHYEMGKKVLEAKKHLLLEKPMAMNATQVKELYHLAQAQDVTAIADFEFRYVPAWLSLAEHLNNDYVGKTRLIKIDWLVTSRADPTREWNWYSQQQAGGGALGAVASHAFDYIHWLFGSISKLCGYLNCAIPERPQAGGKMKPVDADDTCLIMMELADGTPVQLSISSVTYGGRGHWVEVYGETGTLVLGSSNLKDYVHGFELFAAPAGKSLKKISIPKKYEFNQVFTDGRLAPFIRVVDRFVTSIDAGTSLVPSLKEGVYSQLLMDLTHRSHQQKTWVDVPNLEEFMANYTRS